MASLTMPTLSSNLAYSSSIAHFISLAKPAHPNRKTGPKFTCNSTKGDQNSSDHDTAGSKNGETSLLKLDRRNVLLGIGGGLYGASTFGGNPSAFAAPLSPTFTACHDATDPDSKEIDCCPPSATAADITDFVPTAPSVIATRPAAQLVDSTYLKKYKTAIEKMRNLSSDDPRSFTAQANVHCAYCNGGYYQDGYADSQLLLDVHNSWLFFPFHRWYLYFFEKICQNMVDDDTFALPFWNWDNPPGMFLPTIFNDSSSPLYDSLRNPSHLSTVLDLSYEGTDSTDSTITVIKNNLYLMYKQMVTQSTTPLSFFGKTFRAGETSDPGAGSIETSPHSNVHRWTGDPNESHGEDMGSFYSAGRDPVFYCHHANVDRMWSLWNSLGGQNFTDSDWLNSSFYFYNEQAKPVKVYVKDCLDTSVLGYTYQTVDIPWLNSKPSPRRTAIELPTAPTPSQVFPTTLEKTITVLVKRPKKKRTKKEKQRAEEVLEISGIQYNIGEFVKFDVYINEDTPDESGPEKTELVGSFINVPHGHSMISTTTKTFAISEVLQELGADEFESVLVTLVPKSSTVTISGVKIKYDSTKVSACAGHRENILQL
nr:polyphenol oxidase I, chloroplastic-like isoform X2 [Coffea arabica]